MPLKREWPAAAALLAASFGSASVAAHPKLLATVPAANVTVVSAPYIELRFNEKLIERFSGVGLTRAPAETATPSADATRVTTKLGNDGRSLLATPVTPLPAGHYRVTWHAVAADTHRVEGRYSFVVK